MLAFLADENFHGAIVRGLRRRRPDLDVVRVQEVGLMGKDDSSVLAWAAQSGRLLLTHDVSTITPLAYGRAGAGLPMPGVVEVPDDLPFRWAIDEILLLAECSRQGEWEGQVVYLPL